MPRLIALLALICLVLTGLWIGLLIADVASAGPSETFEQVAAHIAVRKILQGVKGWVEGQIEPVWVADVELIVFVMAFGVFVAALIALLARPLTWTSWLTACGAGIVWLVIWYAPITFKV